MNPVQKGIASFFLFALTGLLLYPPSLQSPPNWRCHDCVVHGLVDLDVGLRTGASVGHDWIFRFGQLHVGWLSIEVMILVALTTSLLYLFSSNSKAP